jgi:hypothetical protein
MEVLAMTMPERIQLRRSKGWRMPPDTVKVDRTTVWGNPAIVGVHGSRAECVKWFAALMLEGLLIVSLGKDEDGEYLADKLVRYRKKAKRNLHTLRGKNLACWCSLPKPGEPDLCHAAVLLALANANVDGASTSMHVAGDVHTKPAKAAQVAGLQKDGGAPDA